MASKKDLQGAISTGIDRLFSANDAQQPIEAQEQHRADDVSTEQREADIEEMTKMIEAAEARKTSGHKGYKMQRLCISLTPSEFDYVRIMAGITGKSMTRFIGDLVSKEASENSDIYKQAKGLIMDARK